MDGGGESEVKGGEDGGEETTEPGEVNDQVLTDTVADFEGDESEYSDIESNIDWEEIDRQYEEWRRAIQTTLASLTRISSKLSPD